MVDPFIQFGGAGVDDEHARDALADAQARFAAWQEACRVAWEQVCAAVQEFVAAFAEAAQQFIDGLVAGIAPIVAAWRRRILYARLSERLPGWLVRPLVAAWPERFLPVLRW